MTQSMFAENRKRDERSQSTTHENVSRDDIVAAFRAAMIGHFRSHIPGTNINEATLLASDYFNHFHELVMLLEAVSSEPDDFAEDLFAWKAADVREVFRRVGASATRTLAIAAYHRAPPRIRANFDDAVARLHGEAVKLVGDLRSMQFYGKQPGVEMLRLRPWCVSACHRRGQRHRQRREDSGTAEDDASSEETAKPQSMRRSTRKKALGPHPFDLEFADQ